MKNVVCPVCGKKGSLQIKYIKTTNGNKIPYYYVAHYEMLKGETRVLNWHYIGKNVPESIKKQTEDGNEPENEKEIEPEGE